MFRRWLPFVRREAVYVGHRRSAAVNCLSLEEATKGDRWPRFAVQPCGPSDAKGSERWVPRKPSRASGELLLLRSERTGLCKSAAFGQAALGPSTAGKAIAQ